MALAETTLSAACGANDSSVLVASATSITVGRFLKIDGEMMKVTKGYVAASTTVPVTRGQSGTAQAAHVVSARVVHGDATDFGDPGVGAAVNYPVVSWSKKLVSITATTATMELPAPGQDLVVFLNGTSVITLTIPVPTKALDGCELTIHSNGVAAHVLTFTGGLSGAGSGYDLVTQNASGAVSYKFGAADETWRSYCQAPMGGTATNIIADVS